MIVEYFIFGTFIAVRQYLVIDFRLFSSYPFQIVGTLEI